MIIGRCKPTNTSILIRINIEQQCDCHFIDFKWERVVKVFNPWNKTKRLTKKFFQTSNLETIICSNMSPTTWLEPSFSSLFSFVHSPNWETVRISNRLREEEEEEEMNVSTIPTTYYVSICLSKSFLLDIKWKPLNVNTLGQAETLEMWLMKPDHFV